MRRGFGIWLLLLLILGGIAIGVGAYNAGLAAGLEQSGRATEVVRVIGPGYGFGFFPFGLILFPLFFFGLFFLFRAAFWGRRWGGPGHGHWGHGPGGKGAMFEEWHRQQHDRVEGDRPESGGEPTSV